MRHFRQKKAEDFTVLRFEMRETSEEGRGEKFRMSLVIGSYCYQLQEMLLKVTLMRNRYLCNTLLRSCVPAFLRSCVSAFLRSCVSALLRDAREFFHLKRESSNIAFSFVFVIV